MALVNRKAGQSAPGWFSSLGAKVSVVIALFLTVRILLAQAPAASDLLVREETDNQGYKYQVPLESLRKNRTEVGKQQNAVRDILGGKSSLSDPVTRTKFRAYFQSYLFPLMTTEEGLKTIATDRQGFIRDLTNSKSPEAHREVIDMTLNSLGKIVQDPAYRPASRYNGMLIISNLNDVEPTGIGAAQSLPEPMRAALQFILQQFLKADRDEIKLAALLGLSRHLEWENHKQPPSTPMQPANKAAAIKALSDLAAEKAVPEGREPDVHVWMRRRAIEGLTQYCSTKADPDVAALMDRLLRDEEDAISVRLAAAASFGKMSLQPPAKVDAIATAKELGYLALVACDAELTRAEAQRKAEFDHESRLTGTSFGGGGEYGSGLSGAGAMPMPGMMGSGGTGSPDGLSGGMPGAPGMRQPLRPPPGSGLMGGTGVPGGDGGYGTGIGGEYGATAVDPTMQDPKHFRVDYLRRKLRQYVYTAQLGLLGGEDRPPTKAGASGSAPTPPQTPATPPAGGNQPAEKKGIYVIAKAQEKKEVDDVYQRVRKVAEAIEAAGDKAMFHEVVKDVRKQLPPLEAITKRLPPAGATGPGAVIDDDSPTPAAPAKAPAAKGNTPPAKGAAPGVPAARPAAPGKSAMRPPMRPQPGVFGQPQRGR